MGRFLSSNEAGWRVLNFFIHDRFPPVEHLMVHLENGQYIYYRKSSKKMKEPPKTTLTAFFYLCQDDKFAQTLLPSEVPKYYTWDASIKEFQRRKIGEQVQSHDGIFATQTLGRVYSVHPNNSGGFYLRMLLHVVRGPTSFQMLRTVIDGHIWKTYRQACIDMGLLEKDQQWDIPMMEAEAVHSPSRLRNLFSIIITACFPSFVSVEQVQGKP